MYLKEGPKLCEPLEGALTGSPRSNPVKEPDDFC